MNDSSHAPMPLPNTEGLPTPDTKPPEQQKAEPTQENTADLPTYTSNPFLVTFEHLTAFISYATSIFITTIVISILGSLLNIASEIGSVSSSSEPMNSVATIEPTVGSSDPAIDVAAVATVVVVIAIALLIGVVIISVIGAVFKGIIAAGVNASIEKRKITFGEALHQMSVRFSALFVAEVLTLARVVGGSILLFVPGVRALLRYQAVPYLIMRHKDLGATQAMKRSKQLYKGHLLEMNGIQFVASLIPILGSTLSAVGTGYSSYQLEAYDKAGIKPPDMHWLNWLAIALQTLLFVFVFAVIMIAILATGDF